MVSIGFYVDTNNSPILSMHMFASHVAKSVSVNISLWLWQQSGPRKSLPCSTGSSLRRLVLQVLWLACGSFSELGRRRTWKGAVVYMSLVHVARQGEFLPKCTTSLGKDRWVGSGRSFRLVLRFMGFWLGPNDSLSFIIDRASPCSNDGYTVQ